MTFSWNYSKRNKEVRLWGKKSKASRNIKKSLLYYNPNELMKWIGHTNIIIPTFLSQFSHHKSPKMPYV